MNRTEGKDGVAFRARNLLTKETAFGLLHFLHHINGTRFEHLCIRLRPESNTDSTTGLLNPRIFDAYSKLSASGRPFRVCSAELYAYKDPPYTSHTQQQALKVGPATSSAVHTAEQLSSVLDMPLNKDYWYWRLSPVFL